MVSTSKRIALSLALFAIASCSQSTAPVDSDDIYEQAVALDARGQYTEAERILIDPDINSYELQAFRAFVLIEAADQRNDATLYKKALDVANGITVTPPHADLRRDYLDLVRMIAAVQTGGRAPAIAALVPDCTHGQLKSCLRQKQSRVTFVMASAYGVRDSRYLQMKRLTDAAITGLSNEN